MMPPPNKILIVDDEPADRELVQRALTDAGLACVVADSGYGALAALDRDASIAVVVSDVSMPGLDGVRLGRAIRERFPEREWLQLLFVTRRVELDLAVSALRLRAVDYLTKPVAPDALVLAVSRAYAAARTHVQAPVARPAEPAADAAEPAADLGAGPLSPAAARSALEYLAELRRLRQQSGVLAGLDESSWAIVLEVYRAEIGGRRLSVSKLCALDEASPTTAWRRIRSMEDAGLLVRDQDPADARRSFVTLTLAAARALADFMSRADALMLRAS